MNMQSAIRILVIGGFAVAGVKAALADTRANTEAPAFWGAPTVDGGKCCATLGEVRENIDRIDAALIALMAERGRYVHEAARFKPNPAAVEDKARVEAIIRKVRRLAEERKLNPDVAETTYRAMTAGFAEDERRVAAEMMRNPAR